MTQPVDATAYLKHANTLQAEAYAEMSAPAPQPVVAPRKVYVNFYAGDVGGSQCYRTPECAKAYALGGPTEAAVEFEEVTLRLPSEQPVAQWQKRHIDEEGAIWTNTNEGDAKWWRDNSQEWEIRSLYTIQQSVIAPEHLTRNQIRVVFMEHGFSVKEGQTDLKEYVYEAANALLRLAPAAQTVHAPELTALKEIQCQLRTVIAQMPADNRGTIESGIKTGLSIALLFVLYAITENGGAV